MVTENKNTVNTSPVTESGASKFEIMEYSTFPLDSYENKMRMFNAHNSAKSLANSKSESDVFEIKDVVAERGIRTKSNNECQNTYIFTADGEVLFTQSNGIATTLNDFYKTFGGFEYEGKYVKAHVVNSELSGNRTYKQLEFLVD